MYVCMYVCMYICMYDHNQLFVVCGLSAGVYDSGRSASRYSWHYLLLHVRVSLTFCFYSSRATFLT